ncbi:MAG: multidrug effflux MFS transporter [Pseudomonadota bacterium]
MASPARKPLPLVEFVALSGLIMASVAFGTDAMMPALSTIGAELAPGAPNSGQLVIAAFFLGVGIGTFVTGPLSDRLGRRPVLLAGLILYAVASLLAWAATSIELLLAARVVQGLGAAGPRVAVVAAIRDLYQGARMAQITSFATAVFMLVPAIAPFMGAWIIDFTGWRGIFIAFALWACLMALWFALRQGETLAPENRRPFRLGAILRGARETLAIREVTVAIAVLTIVFAILIATLQSVPLIFEVIYDRQDSFPTYFAATSIVSIGGSFLNARLVARLGMGRVVMFGLLAQLAASVALSAVGLAALSVEISFVVFLIYMQIAFFTTGLTVGNVTAIAMVPLGHQAGLGASLINALATICGLAIAVPLGLAFNGTTLPLSLGVVVLCCLGLALLTRLPKPPVVDTGHADRGPATAEAGSGR